jgi:hypothetical protein
MDAERVESLPSQSQENLFESLVSRPERDVSQKGGQQQVNVNVTGTFPHQAIILYESDGLFLVGIEWSERY